MSNRPSPSLIISCLALFIALSGSAIALEGKNTVDSGDIKPQAVKTQDLAPDSVTFVELANDAVNGPAILDGAVASRQLADLVQTGSALTPISPNSTNYAFAYCPNGGQVLSGGYLAGTGDFVVTDSQIVTQPQGWFIRARAGAGGASFTTVANCLD